MKVHYCHLSNLSIQEVKKTLYLSQILLEVKASLSETKTKTKTTTKSSSMYIHMYIYFNFKCILLVLINFICLMNRIQRSSTFLEKKKEKTFLFLLLDGIEYIFSVIGILMVTISVVQKLTVLQRAGRQMF